MLCEVQIVLSLPPDEETGKIEDIPLLYERCCCCSTSSSVFLVCSRLLYFI